MATDSRFSLVDVIAMLGIDQEETFDLELHLDDEMDGVFEGDDPGEWDEPDPGEGDEANNQGEGEEEREYGKKFIKSIHIIIVERARGK